MKSENLTNMFHVNHLLAFEHYGPWRIVRRRDRARRWHLEEEVHLRFQSPVPTPILGPYV
jgi:hypothetical protein